jgi:hypothetical protein
MDIDEIRKKFEQWAELCPREWEIERCGEHSAWPGQYRDYVVQSAWEAWYEASQVYTSNIKHTHSAT